MKVLKYVSIFVEISCPIVFDLWEAEIGSRVNNILVYFLALTSFMAAVVLVCE